MFGRSPKIFVGPRCWTFSTKEGSTPRRKLKITSGSRKSTEIDLSEDAQERISNFWITVVEIVCDVDARRDGGNVYTMLHHARIEIRRKYRPCRIDSFALRSADCAYRLHHERGWNNKFSNITTLSISARKKQRRSRYYSEPVYKIMPSVSFDMSDSTIAYLSYPATFLMNRSVKLYTRAYRVPELDT